ncbi:MAG: uracil-DNA glycosylase [Clostridia bacterium]|nr:uracil-DNA glycosylase [Clostridia bacterium]
MDENQRYIELEKLYSEYRERYPGGELVFGDGNAYSGYVLIGEAPGKDEVIQKRPFVGIAGGKLKDSMDFLGWSRENIYITNAIKYRLSRINVKTGRKSNRPATIAEVRDSWDLLEMELEILSPVLVVTLGNVPLRSVTKNFTDSIGSLHGKIMNAGKWRLFPMYHPASIIYNRSLGDVCRRDLEKLAEIIKEV